MRPASRLLPVFLLLAACAKPEIPPVSAAQREAADAENQKFETRLNETIRGAHAVGPCGTVVAGEWPEGFPVPAETPKGRAFKIFFYPLAGTPPGEPKLYSPSMIS